MITKQNILTASAVSVLLASVVALSNVLLASDPAIVARLGAVSVIFGLGSIGLFFVGLAYPNHIHSVILNNDVTLKNVSNQ